MRLRLLLLGTLLTVSTTLMAEALRDPTQLPSNVATVATANATNAGPTLQSIILSDSVRAAIINGQRVNIGDQFQQLKLVALTENSATLQSADGERQTLKMPHISFGIKKRSKRKFENSQPRVATKTTR